MTLTPDVLVLLDRYRTGECTPAEAAEVERRLAADSDSARELAWLRGLDQSVEDTETWDVDALWHGMRNKRPAITLVPAPRRASWSRYAVRIAAAVAIVAGAYTIARVAGRPSDSPGSGSHSTLSTYTTRLGERAEFRLPDGSHVTLAAGSRLEIRSAFGRQSRDVYLDGHGYFDVVANPAVPFRVHSGRAITQVLGTRFGVRAYRADSATSIIVAEGSVAFTTRSATPASVVLAPGDLARLDRGNRLAVEHGVTVGHYVGWTEGRLDFLNTPLRDVIPELERWYDLEITVRDSAVGQRPLTASFQQESTDHMLRLLARTLDLRVERTGRAVMLHANP